MALMSLKLSTLRNKTIIRLESESYLSVYKSHMNHTTYDAQHELLKKLFPFFLVVGEDGNIMETGKSVFKFMPRNLVGEAFDEVFKITSPIFVQKLKDCLQFPREVFIIRCQHNHHIALKGQILQLPGSNMYLFVGSPLINDTKTIKSFNLNNNDFAIFNSLPEYLFALQTHTTSLKDATELSQKLNQQTNELKQTNEELTTLSEHKDELLTSIMQKNEELERFAHIASHDLKQPLSTVINFSNILKMTLPIEEGSENDLYLDYVINGGKQMMALIEDVLEYSKLGEQRKEIVDIELNDLMEEIIKSIAFKIQSKNADVEVVHHLPTLRYDKHRMILLFKNIIENGIKYNQSERPLIQISSEEKETFMLFKIVDNGIGIEEKYFYKLFKMFSRLERQSDYEGTGLGLSLCKKIIGNMGGSIYLTSEYGVGSQFYLKIPKKYFMV